MRLVDPINITWMHQMIKPTVPACRCGPHNMVILTENLNEKTAHFYCSNCGLKGDVANSVEMATKKWMVLQLIS